MPKSKSKSKSNSLVPKAYGPVSIRSLAAHPMRGPELKWFDQYLTNLNLVHNASDGVTAGAMTSRANLTQFPSTGTTSITRIGDRVTAKRVDVRLWLSNKGDRSNVIYRITAAILPGWTSGSGSAWSDITTSTSNCILAFPSSDKVTFVYDHVINPDQSANAIYPSANTAKERSYYHEFSLPLNQAMSVNSGNFCDTSNIGLYVNCYDAYGTLTTDTIASFAYAVRLWFTDS